MGVVERRHGAGGRLMEQFLKNSVFPYFYDDDAGIGLKHMDDSAAIGNIAFTIDSYTVHPYIFPGGNIGKLSISGTVNDLLSIGALPKALLIAMVIEEGFPEADIKTISRSIGETAKLAGVRIKGGDTKVMPRGSLDKIVITSSGVGFWDERLEENFKTINRNLKWLLDSNIRPGDKIILTGFIGDHGIALLSARGDLSFEVDVQSDVAPLVDVYEAAIRVGGIVSIKDPTRGGVAEALNEWSLKSGYGIEVFEERIPIRESVMSACEFLGIDPLELGNEGKFIIAVDKEYAEDVLQAIKKTKNGKNAEIIGEVVDNHKYVVMNTLLGSKRIIDRPAGDPLPRIC